MKLDSEVVGILKEIPWFSNCGHPMSRQIAIPHRYVSSWDEAKRSYSDQNWEDTTLEASNELKAFLHKRARSQYNEEWSRILQEAKAVVARDLDPVLINVRQAAGLDQQFVDSVRWDILGAMMEYSYKVPGRPAFFSELLKVYQSGNFPCGWVGQWPDGELVVY